MEPIDDASGPMSVAFHALTKTRTGGAMRLTARGPTVLVTTDTGIVETRVDDTAHLIDRASILVVAKGATVRVTPKGPVGHLFALTVSRGLVETTAATYDGFIDRKLLERYLAKTEPLPRTNWLDEICHRYLFERAECRRKNNDATRFLEVEITKELYFLKLEREKTRDRRAAVEETKSPLVARALLAIEGRLFETDVLSSLAKECRASESSLLRAFKREMGVAPSAYVRGRRLDEARLLLMGKRFTVGEVAANVGYKSFAAFSEAFRARFGQPPSAVRRGVTAT